MSNFSDESVISKVASMPNIALRAEQKYASKKIEPFFPRRCLMTTVLASACNISSYVPRWPYLQIIFSIYSRTEYSLISFFQNIIVSEGIIWPSFVPIFLMESSSNVSKREVRNSRFITIMSILDKYLVKSQYLRRIIPTNALTEIPILSASSSKMDDNSLSKRNDLVTVEARVTWFISDLKSAIQGKFGALDYIKFVLAYATLCPFVYFLRRTDNTVHMLLICTVSSAFAMRTAMQRKIMLGYTFQSIFRRLI
jgi:hypothetical protein